MALEIEHKYLVVNESYKDMARSVSHIEQGYLNRDPDRTVRVRIKDNEAYVTIKGITKGDTRLEFEYPVPVDDARRLLSLCEGRIVCKDRYYVEFGGHIWEVDVFTGDLAPLKIAEIELSCSTHSYPLPPFAGKEVTDNPAFFNSNM